MNPLREALQEYVQHKPDCELLVERASVPFVRCCTCGLSAALALPTEEAVTSTTFVTKQLVCHVCKEPVRPSFNLGKDKDAWHWVNVAPDAASGGTLLPIHERCASSPISTPATPEAAEQREGPSEQILDAMCAMPELHDMLRAFYLNCPGIIQWQGTDNGDTIEKYARRKAAFLYKAILALAPRSPEPDSPQQPVAKK